MRRRVPADPLCSSLLRLPHVHLTIVDGFADPSPTRDSNACRRIVGRGLAAAVDAGLAEGRGRMSAAVRGRRRRKSAVRQRAWRRRSGSRNCRCKLGRELSESRCPWSAQGVEGPATPGLTGNDGARMRQPELLGAREAEVASRDRGLESSGPRRTGACLLLWLSVNMITNQCVTSCHVARTVVEVRYLFRRRAGCVGN